MAFTDRLRVVRDEHRDAHRAFLAHFRACRHCVAGALCPEGDHLDREADAAGRRLESAA